MNNKLKYIIIIGTILSAIIFLVAIKYKELQAEKEKNDFDKFFAQWSVFGIDVSKYQENIEWNTVEKIFDEHKIHFAFIRATYGKTKVDKYFKHNWSAKKKSDIMCGAYHYYIPNQNSIEQAKYFINNVTLKTGDLPPVLDIEESSSTQSMKSLKIGLQKWLNMVEKHYGVKPIIYSGSKYYEAFLKKEFKDYTLWVANYNRTKAPVQHDWKFWQYSSHGRVKGIDGYVDINVFDGTVKELENMCIK